MVSRVTTPTEFQKWTGVSRETLSRFESYAELLCKWQERINLIGPGTADALWHRHFWDSAQLWPHIPEKAETLSDLGSGAGFPGLVLAVLSRERPRPLAVTLVESDARKGAFLTEAIRVTGAPAQVQIRRIEARAVPADVVTARALAPLPKLCALAAPYCRPGTVCLFHKGEHVVDELQAAEKHWVFTVDPLASASESSASIVKLTGLHPRPI